MLESHKVRAWMLTVPTFTAEELHGLSGVKLTTVRTVLHRDQANLKPVAVTEQGEARSRGGQPKRFQVTVAGRQTIEREVDATRRVVGDLPADSSEVDDRQGEGTPFGQSTTLTLALNVARDAAEAIGSADLSSVEREAAAIAVQESIKTVRFELRRWSSALSSPSVEESNIVQIGGELDAMQDGLSGGKSPDAVQDTPPDASDVRRAQETYRLLFRDLLATVRTPQWLSGRPVDRPSPARPAAAADAQPSSARGRPAIKRRSASVEESNALHRRELGRALRSLTAKDVFEELSGSQREPLVSVDPRELVYVALKRMESSGKSQLPVVVDEQPMGEVNESFLARAITENGFAEQAVEAVMARSPWPVIDAGMPAIGSLEAFASAAHVLVKEQSRLIGVVSRSDVLRVFGSYLYHR